MISSKTNATPRTKYRNIEKIDSTIFSIFLIIRCILQIPLYVWVNFGSRSKTAKQYKDRKSTWRSLSIQNKRTASGEHEVGKTTNWFVPASALIFRHGQTMWNKLFHVIGMDGFWVSVPLPLYPIRLALHSPADCRWMSFAYSVSRDLFFYSSRIFSTDGSIHV